MFITHNKIVIPLSLGKGANVLITFLSNLVKQTLQKNQSDTERQNTPDYVRIHHDFAVDREQPTSNSTLDSTSEGNLFI